MATAKNETAATVKAGTVTIKLQRAEKGQPDSVFVAHNGKTYQIKKGVPVDVPVAVAEIIASANRAAEAADAYAAEAAKAYKA